MTLVDDGEENVMSTYGQMDAYSTYQIAVEGLSLMTTEGLDIMGTLGHSQEEEALRNFTVWSESK